MTPFISIQRLESGIADSAAQHRTSLRELLSCPVCPLIVWLCDRCWSLREIAHGYRGQNVTAGEASKDLTPDFYYVTPWGPAQGLQGEMCPHKTLKLEQKNWWALPSPECLAAC